MKQYKVTLGVATGKKEKNPNFSVPGNSKLGGWRDKEEPAKETKMELSEG